MKDVKKYSEELSVDVHKLLDKTLADATEGDFHLLRVEIKKICALISFLSFVYSISRRDDEKLRKLFRQAGKIRELQLDIHQLKELMADGTEGKEDFLDELKMQVDKQTKKYHSGFKTKGKKIFDRIFQRIDECFLFPQVETPAHYFEKISKQIMRILKLPQWRNEQVHLMRIKVKELKYNLKLSDDENLKEVLFSVEELDIWASTLGEWHDDVQFVRKLKKMRRDILPGSPLDKELKRIQSDEMEKAKSLLNEFREVSKKV